jgi:Fe-S cluster assembly ATP-binding protein
LTFQDKSYPYCNHPKGINKFRTAEKGLLLITHYNRILEYIVPDFVHVMIKGKIVKSGGKELAKEIEVGGYEGFKV